MIKRAAASLAIGIVLAVIQVVAITASLDWFGAPLALALTLAVFLVGLPAIVSLLEYRQLAHDALVWLNEHPASARWLGRTQSPNMAGLEYHSELRRYVEGARLALVGSRSGSCCPDRRCDADCRAHQGRSGPWPSGLKPEQNLTKAEVLSEWLVRMTESNAHSIEIIGAGEGIRTRDLSLEGCCSSDLGGRA